MIERVASFAACKSDPIWLLLEKSFPAVIADELCALLIVDKRELFRQIFHFDIRLESAILVSRGLRRESTVNDLHPTNTSKSS